ncbi:MAG TPA: pesticidal protein Cry7Aa [Flavobacterium sp.]|jgi:predicted GH43/DUF377 family glycosyl hydrolase
MIQVRREGIILEKTELQFENEGVLNPAVIHADGNIHLFYRAVSTGNRSSIGYCRLSDPITVTERYMHPVLVPEFDYECQGVEDPRIVLIDETYILTYTAYNGYIALGAMATATGFDSFTKHGTIVPQIDFHDFKEMTASANISRKYYRFDQSSNIIWDKNVIFFPRKINGEYALLHRIRPGIQLVRFTDISDLTSGFWQNYFTTFSRHIVLDPAFDHEVSYIGGGCPPIETGSGWLLIYHGVRDTIQGYVYCACAALLDIDDPVKEIARLPYPLFEPKTSWEKEGEINNVCFPTGTVTINDTLYIYYGAADERIACASVSLSGLLAELKQWRR